MKHLLLTTIAAVLVVGCGPPETPGISIHIAAINGDIEAIKQHLAAGTDVNAKNGFGTTPLFYAAGDGHKEIAELLIAKGADVNAKNVSGQHQGYAPLDVAIKYGRTEIADLLRKHGAKSGAEDSIYVAVAVENIEAVKQHLVIGADVNAKDAGGGTPLLVAASRGHKEIVELLIAEGADVNAKRTNGSTPLHIAAYFGHKEIAELLIAEGADVNAKDEFSKTTPLDWASSRKHPETADLLRKHGGKTGEELKAEGK